MDILLIALCVVSAGAADSVHIEMFGNAQLAWLREHLEHPNGIPSHDTFARVFSLLESQSLE